MKHTTTLLLAALLIAHVPAHAAVRILATTADWGALARELGGDEVDVYTATNALQDVHHIDAKPSLIARARNADLVVATGAELEMGWLPVLLRESGNRNVQPGQSGYFEAATFVNLIDVPTTLDRAMGDFHSMGNPHVQLDPHNVQKIAAALTDRLVLIDAAHAEHYRTRGTDFQRRWSEAIARWEARGARLEGVPIVVMHQDQNYLSRWLGLDQLASIEPKPGVPPSAGYLAQLVRTLSARPPELILVNAYNDPKAAQWLADRVHARVVTLPFSVGGSEQATDLFGLFDDTLDRLLAALP